MNGQPMIVIKVELWKHGRADEVEDLGTCHITNDLHGSLQSGGALGDYTVRLLTGKKYSKNPGRVWKAGKVVGFPGKAGKPQGRGALAVVVHQPPQLIFREAGALSAE